MVATALTIGMDNVIGWFVPAHRRGHKPQEN
jgi:hypothetical protein